MSKPYTDKILDHYKNPRNYGSIDGANAFAEEKNALCGDEIAIYLSIDNSGTISRAKFQGVACIFCKASASILTGDVIGKSKDDVLNMDEDYLRKLLDLTNLRGSKMRCALLPLKAMKRAIDRSSQNK